MIKLKLYFLIIVSSFKIYIDINNYVIISLTSYPLRINYVHKTIKSLLEQTLKPKKIILWLAESEFPNKNKDLPKNLLLLKNNIVSIKYYKENIKSYKKLIPTLEISK